MALCLSPPMSFTVLSHLSYHRCSSSFWSCDCRLVVQTAPVHVAPLYALAYFRVEAARRGAADRESVGVPPLLSGARAQKS